jgi:hypothetical protein
MAVQSKIFFERVIATRIQGKKLVINNTFENEFEGINKN